MVTENLGAFADAARAREDKLVQRLAASVKLDGEFAAVLRDAVHRNRNSRQRLDAIEAEVRQAAATWRGLDTPAGARQFQRFLTGKTREIHQVVADATADSGRKAQLVHGLAGRYRFGEDLPPQLGDPKQDGDAPHDPTIDGTGTDPVLEQEEYDLGATIPNHPEVLLPGDPNTAENELTFPDGGRPIPTGTAVGPDGKQYGFFSDAQGDVYTSPQSTVVDLADPSQRLGALSDTSGTDIGQASGVYDPATNTMWIVGNVNGTGQRGMWQSAPIDRGNPNGWVSTLQPRGMFTNEMNGNRENQIVALPQGGFLLTGAADSRGVHGVTAASPQGLLTAPAHPLVGLIPSPDAGQQPGWAYGPTIVGTEVLPNGQQQVTMRVSTWDPPVGFEPTPDAPLPPYTPRTYTTTFTVTP